MEVLPWLEEIEEEIENEPVSLDSGKLGSAINHLDFAITELKSIGFTYDNSGILEDITVCADKLNVMLADAKHTDRLK